MAKRHTDALAIINGGCNPSGIALAIVEACAEARAEGKTAHKDIAVQVMAYQLSFICGAVDLDEFDQFSKAIKECGKLAAEGADRTHREG